MIDRNAFRSVSYGLYIVTARDADQKFGCVINTFQQVTSEPPRASIALNKENATTQAILNSGRYAVTVLDEQASMDLIGVFGFRSSLEVDKFADVVWEEDAHGVPYLAEQCVARFSLRVVETLDVGTHIMFIGEVEECETVGKGTAMTYAYYHDVKRGKTPKKASSYVPKEKAPADAEDPKAAPERAELSDQPAEAAPKKYAWQCTICGHIEYVDELDEDYECPLCGMGADMFERVEA